ncbi:MAG: hypothetical protein ACYDBX_01500 [Patescibacteria group bacterium]
MQENGKLTGYYDLDQIAADAAKAKERRTAILRLSELLRANSELIPSIDYIKNIDIRARFITPKSLYSYSTSDPEQKTYLSSIYESFTTDKGLKFTSRFILVDSQGEQLSTEEKHNATLLLIGVFLGDDTCIGPQNIRFGMIIDNDIVDNNATFKISKNPDESKARTGIPYVVEQAVGKDETSIIDEIIKARQFFEEKYKIWGME